MRFSPNLNLSLWILQVLLAVFFALGSGAPKLLLSAEQLPLPIPLPDLLIKSIGVAEVLGALGLLLPGLLKIRPALTPLAAACLVALTLCATVYQLLARQPESAIFAFVIALLCALVAVGRSRRAPLRARGRTDAGVGAALA
jgi:hypothetical protein